MRCEALIAMIDALDAGDPDGEKHAFAIGMLLAFLSQEGYGDIVQAYRAAQQRVPFGYRDGGRGTGQPRLAPPRTGKEAL